MSGISYCLINEFIGSPPFSAGTEGPACSEHSIRALRVASLIKEITMHDQAAHSTNKSAKPEPSTKSTPTTPTKPDPHAGHDMGKSEKPATPRKVAEKK